MRYSLTGKDILLHYPASLRETAVVADLASYALSEEEARAVKTLNICALSTDALACQGADLTHPNPSVRQASAKKVKEALMLAKELDCPVLLGEIRGKQAPGLSCSQYLQNFSESLNTIMDEAHRLDVHIGIEVLNRYVRPYLYTADSMAAYLEGVDPQIQLVLNTFHMNIEESSLGDCLKKYKERICHVFLADNNNLFPGQGFIDFKKLGQKLQEIGYPRSVSVKCLRQGDTVSPESELEFLSVME